MTMWHPRIRQLTHTWLQRTVPCHRAATKHEFDAIARLRYAVHIEEQNVDLPEADRVARRIWYPDDDLPDTFHYYAGSPERILGCLRVRVWEPGQVPEHLKTFYSMQRLPDIERRTTCEVSKMIVVPKLRGTAAMAALSGFSIYQTVSRHQNQLMFACCVPGLVRAYQAIGLRTYGGTLKNAPWGLAVPLIGLSHDLEHTYRVGSPWYPALRRLAQENKLPEDVPAYRAMAASDRTVITAPRAVEQVLQALAATGGSAFLRGLPPKALEGLGRYGISLDVPPGVVVCREGVAEREVFLIVRGEFAVLRDGARIATLRDGEVFGEMAFMSEGGRRSAAVCSVTQGQVIVLRRRFLREIAASDPRSALAIQGSLIQDLLRKLARAPMPPQAPLVP